VGAVSTWLVWKNERKRKAEKRKTFEVSDYVYQFHLRTFLDER